MIYTLLLMALVITWLPGWVWLNRAVPKGDTARQVLVAGYALLFGFILIPLLMRLLSMLGIELSFASISLAAGCFTLAGLLLPASWRADTKAFPACAPPQRWEKLLIALCLALIGARLLTLGLEVSVRPVTSWDAKQHWAKQARIFFEARDVVTYVSLQEWLNTTDAVVYTNMHPNYPVTAPLVMAWVSLAMGEWHDSLVNLPWLFFYLAMGLIFYGQARASGAGAGVAIAFTYMLLSLPYLNIQVALAGYADILMAACYLGAIAAFFNWSINREWWQGMLATLFALSCLLVKNEGLYWLLTFVPGLVFVMLGLKRGLLAALGLLVLLLLTLWLLPGDVTIGGHSLNQIKLTYRPQSWPAIHQSFFAHDNWHLVSFVFITLLVCGLVFAQRAMPGLAGVSAAIISGIALYLALYLMTRHAHGAVRFTSLNRVALQLIPAIWFVAMLYFQALSQNRQALEEN